MRSFITTIALIIISALPVAAHATNSKPAPVTISGVTIPGEVVGEMQKHAIACERVFSKFSLDLKYLTQMDISGDGKTDYILSSRGFLCNGQHNEFKNVKGDNYYFFVARADGTYLQQNLDELAYEMKIENGFRPPYITFTTRCSRHPDALNYGELRVRWENDRIDIRGKNSPCRRHDRHRHPVDTVEVTPPSAEPVVPPPVITEQPVVRPTNRLRPTDSELEEFPGANSGVTSYPR